MSQDLLKVATQAAKELPGAEFVLVNGGIFARRMTAEPSLFWQVADQAAKELPGFEIVLMDECFIIRSTATTRPKQDITPAVVEASSSPEIMHYAPQLVQPPQSPLWLQWMQLLQQNPAMAMMFSMLQQQVQQLPQYMPPQVAQVQPPQVVQVQPPQVVQVQQVQPQQVQQVQPQQVQQVQPQQVQQVQPPQVVHAEKPQKSRWSDVTGKDSQQAQVQKPLPGVGAGKKPLPGVGAGKKPRTQAPKGETTRSRVNKVTVSGVQLPYPNGFTPAPGCVTGRNMPTNRRYVQICVRDHTRRETDGEEPWVCCVNMNGDRIPGATGPYANRAAHRNAVCTLPRDQAPTTADFCNQGGRDIYGCTDPTCTSNHVGHHESDPEKLRQNKIPLRRQNNDDRLQEPRREYKPRDRAVNDNDDRPQKPTLGDFIPVSNDTTAPAVIANAADGLQIDDEGDDKLTMSSSTLTNADTSGRVSPHPTIMKKSIKDIKIATRPVKTTLAEKTE